jgi:CHAD domain-containing protein
MIEKQEIIDGKKNYFQKIFKDRWKTYRSELKRCRNEPTEEAVHDLRVATRRLLALLNLLRDITPHPRLQKLRRTLKNQLNDLDDLRDTQVMLVEVSESLEDLPELEPFYKFLSKRERRLLRSTARSIKAFKYSSVRKQMEAIRKTLLQQKQITTSNQLMLQVVDDAYATLLRRYRRIEPVNIATLHRARIAFKKFRYTVEIVHPLVPDFPEGNFKNMHDYQGMMGDIQDVEIFISAFEDFADGDAAYDPEPVLRYYQQRHTEVVSAYIEDMHQITTFWRTKPETPFPWEVPS